MSPIKLKVSVGEICGSGLNYLPLLVDEGYLLIDFRGGKSHLFVKKR
jgi:hypothetical protein